MASFGVYFHCQCPLNSDRGPVVKERKQGLVDGGVHQVKHHSQSNRQEDKENKIDT